jgi:hypothetical protein
MCHDDVVKSATSLTLRLYVGNKFTGIWIQSDEKWPSMWRVHAADRQPSDIVNLTRAKDAALGWARQRNAITSSRRTFCFKPARAAARGRSDALKFELGSEGASGQK